jgi:hypothetical protein
LCAAGHGSCTSGPGGHRETGSSSCRWAFGAPARPGHHASRLAGLRRSPDDAGTGPGEVGFASAPATDRSAWSPAVDAARDAPHHHAWLNEPDEVSEVNKVNEPGDEYAGDGPYGQDDTGEQRDDNGDDASVPQETAAAVAYWYDIDPELHPRDIAARIGRSERTVRRYLPPGSRSSAASPHLKPHRHRSAWARPEFRARMFTTLSATCGSWLAAGGKVSNGTGHSA